MIKIPFLQLGDAVAERREEIDAAIRRVLDSGWYLLGPELEAFETEYLEEQTAKEVGSASSLKGLFNHALKPRFPASL